MSETINRQASILTEQQLKDLYRRYISAIKAREITRRQVHELLGGKCSKQHLHELEKKQFEALTIKMYHKLDLILIKLGV